MVYCVNLKGFVKFTRMIMKKLFAFLLLTYVLLLAAPVYAQQDYPRDITVGWDNPDSYVDDTLMEPGDLEAIRIEIYRQDDTVPVMTAPIPDSGEGLSQLETFADAIPRPGTYRIEGYAIVIGGIESDVSVPAFGKYRGKPRSIVIVTIE